MPGVLPDDLTELEGTIVVELPAVTPLLDSVFTAEQVDPSSPGPVLKAGVGAMRRAFFDRGGSRLSRARSLLAFFTEDLRPPLCSFGF